MIQWHDAVFYHIYPLGLCGAPRTNDGNSPPVDRLRSLDPWIDHISSLGASALYLGPVFESMSHGYDTVDLFAVDRRLGTVETLVRFVERCHSAGIKVVLDAVLNHVGRSSPIFEDVRRNLDASTHADWISGLRFDSGNRRGDPFSYDTWDGHLSLPKLDTGNPDVREYLLKAVEHWIERYDIDGLRLDAADHLDVDFIRALRRQCKSVRPDFFLLGEMVHGDYRLLANEEMLDSVTNYECYKGLYSSHNDGNLFEIAYSLNRQFGPDGIYRGLPLYNFADNHDVDRIVEVLREPSHLHSIHVLLFTMPGVPSIYYGSEWGIPGARTETSDAALRPQIDLSRAAEQAAHPELPGVIERLSGIRNASAALRRGNYRQLHVEHEAFAFVRRHGKEIAVVAVNSGREPVTLDLLIPELTDGTLFDALDGHTPISVAAGRCRIEGVPPSSGRILLLE